jgi:hypothetical protein
MSESELLQTSSGGPVKKGNESDPTREEAAAISMAMHRYMSETVHDIESYIITIKRKDRL